MENENPLVEWIVSALGFVCLAALAIQTWFFVDWLMGPADWWMKYMTLCFFDIFGGIWLVLRLFHTPPSKATYQMVGAGIVVCFILSALTTVAWCFIFITRTPLSPGDIANMVATARWLVVIAVIFNAFMMIFYSVETRSYHQRSKNPARKRWATEKNTSAAPRRHTSPARVRVAQTATASHRPVRKLPTTTRKQIASVVEVSEEVEAPDEEQYTSADEEIDEEESEEEEEVETAPLPQRLAAVFFPKSGKRK
jgi:glucan phosphoethanolaminetransferase (alkaline phosphatase superfamily)